MNWKQFIAVMKVDEGASAAKYRLAARSADNLAVWPRANRPGSTVQRLEEQAEFPEPFS